MAFNNTEKLNISSSLALQLSNLAPAPVGQQNFYNISTPWNPIIKPSNIWLYINDILPANNVLQADNNITIVPTLIEKRKTRLTLLTTTNYRGYLCRTEFNNHNSDMLENWILPSLIPSGTGVSNGYSIRLYNGDPDNGGTEISTVYNADSDGNTSWQFYYSNGYLQVSTDNSNNFKTIYDTNGLYVVGYRYIGKTLADVDFSGNSKVETKERFTVVDNTMEYTLAHIPINDSEKVVVQGIFFDSDDDYMITGNKITFKENTLEIGKKIIITYSY